MNFDFDSRRTLLGTIFTHAGEDRIAPTTSEIVAAFKAVWDSWGPRMERILYNAVAALIEAENTSRRQVRPRRDRG